MCLKFGIQWILYLKCNVFSWKCDFDLPDQVWQRKYLHAKIVHLVQLGNTKSNKMAEGEVNLAKLRNKRKYLRSEASKIRLKIDSELNTMTIEEKSRLCIHL